MYWKLQSKLQRLRLFIKWIRKEFTIADHVFHAMLTYLRDNPIICDMKSLSVGKKNQVPWLKT